MSAPICLVTLNSTYQHCSFGLRYLKANLKELESQCVILEPTIQIGARDLVERILALKPQIVGFGVYIWNAEQSLQVVSLLKKVAPEIQIVLGGPEVSFETEAQSIVQKADYTIKGEAEFLFYELCKKILSGQLPEQKIISGALPAIQEIKLPYELYSDEDIKNRIIYVEASRGCPYKCEYCLSSLDKSVRSFDLDQFLGSLERLISRGAREFKFVDRTFNLSPTTSLRILNFFLERISLGLFLHFEMVPDRLPKELKELLQKFPEGSLQFEIGIQTLNAEVAALVSRKNDLAKVKENFQFLTQKTHVHIHADLIAGLPGETRESFGRGFDELLEYAPHEIQLGILKRLKGTPIIRHDQNWQMHYQDFQPFQVLKTKTMSFEDLQFLNRFAKYWDLYANSGQFKDCMVFLKGLASERYQSSLFTLFSDLTHFLSVRFSQSYGHSLETLAEALWDYLKQIDGIDLLKAEESLINDYCYRVKRRDLPRFLKNSTHSVLPEKAHQKKRRQENHTANL